MRVVALSAVLLLGACYDPNYYEYAPPGGRYVAQMPPEPYLEDPSSPPEDGMIWCDGYWGWSSAGYAWIGGVWLRPPHAGLYWYPGGYIRGPGGYVRVRGRWGAPGWHHPYNFIHRPAYAYRAPVYAGHRGGSYYGGGRYRGWHGGGYVGGGHVGGGHGGHGGRRR